MKSSLNHLIEIRDGQPVTSSFNIASVFGFKHNQVIRMINYAGCSDGFKRIHFIQDVRMINGCPVVMCWITQLGFKTLTRYIGSTPKPEKLKKDYADAFKNKSGSIEKLFEVIRDYSDNNGWISKSELTRKTRLIHVDLRDFYLKELISDELITFKSIKSANNKDSLFYKATK